MSHQGQSFKMAEKMLPEVISYSVQRHINVQLWQSRGILLKYTLR